MKSYIFFIFVFLSFMQGVLAQQELFFQQINDKNGRPLGRISGVTQDEDGFLWFSSSRGLFRYDGYKTIVYKQTPDSSSIAYSNLSGLYYDSRKNMWISHMGQFAACRNGKNHPICDSLTAIDLKSDFSFADDNQNLWIGSKRNGLLRYNYSSSEIKKYHYYKPSYAPDTYLYIDSVLQYATPIGGIKHAGNNVDTTILIDIKEDGYYLIMSTFELNFGYEFDYGILLDEKGKTIWEVTKSLVKGIGGSDDFKIQLQTVILKKGRYYLRYVTDNANSYNNWLNESDAPDKVHFYGMMMYALKEINWNKKLLNTYSSPNFINSDQVNGITFDNDSCLWLVNDHGLEKYNTNDKAFNLYSINWTNYFGNKPNINFLYVDKKNNFWIGSDVGLLKYSHSSKSYQLFANNAHGYDTLLTSNNITCMEEDKYGNFWIGTNDGINYLNTENNKIFKYKKNRNGLLDNKIFDIYIDHSGNIYFATNSGLNKLVPPRFQFCDFKIENRFTKYPVLINNKNELWFRGQQGVLRRFDRKSMDFYDITLPDKIFETAAMEGKNYIFNQIENYGSSILLVVGKGVYLIDKKTGEVVQENKINNFFVEDIEIENNISVAIPNKKKQYWLCGLDALYLYDVPTNNIVDTVMHDGSSLLIEDNDFVKDYVIDGDNYWLRTLTGIELFEPNNKRIALIDTVSKDIRYSSEINGNLYIDKNKDVWAMIFPNLHRISPNKKVEIYSYKTQSVAGECRIYCQTDSVLWIHSTNGLLRFSKNTHQFEHYNVGTSNFVANEIYSVVADKENLWLSTLKGLTKFNIKSRLARNYFTSDDFNSYVFSGNSVKDVSQKGELLFFTSQGMVSYFPDSINFAKPKLAISNFSISKKSYFLDSLLDNAGVLNLSYNQNSISFEITANDFTEPYSNRYAYKLENYDEEWSEREANNRTITYNKLPPGQYIFRIKASNNDNVWAEKEMVKIVIIPPFWQTLGFKIALFLIIIGIIWGLIKIRERQLLNDKQELERIVKERTAEIEKQKIELAKQRDEVMTHRDYIAKQNEEITDSILYASRIQSAILPTKEFVEAYLPEHFILFKPRDIVSGDFYWMGYHNNRIVITAADCTGHGVPGAFMSMLGVTFLNQIVIKDDVIAPNDILNRLREQIMTSLKQTGKENEAKDGMDISLCSIDMENNKLYFSGAYNHLYLIRNNELIIYKADKMPIGIYMGEEKSFTMDEIDIQKGDVIYMSSDGYVDQFGGEKGRKFMAKNFKDLLLKIHHYPAEKQKEILDKTIKEWQGNKYEQIDDIVVIGIKFKE